MPHTIALLETAGRVRDNLHGTIPFTEIERRLFDAPEFQRLRRIGQLAFVKYVFPGAQHSRFEHSLGTMHLAGTAYENLLRNQRKLLGSLQGALSEVDQNIHGAFALREKTEGSILHTESVLSELERNAHVAQCLRLAALAHDLGHTPFSHSGEGFLPSWRQILAALPEMSLPPFLLASLTERAERHGSETRGSTNPRPRHEIFTLLIAARILGRVELNDTDRIELIQDVCSIIDDAIPPAPRGAIATLGIQTLLHEIVSGEIDADRMDYLLRDSQQCGVIYGLFDRERLLDSTVFYRNGNGHCHLALRRSGLSAFEDFLRARLSMYEQVYFHKTSTACQAMLEFAQQQADAVSLPVDLDRYIAMDDASFLTHFEQGTSATRSQFAPATLRHLLLERRLWKRIYEENVPRASAASMPSLCPTVLAILANEGVPCRLVEDKTTLTRFTPRGRGKRSENSLKVVAKDLHGLAHLAPIENHCALINRLDEENVIRRIFIATTDEQGRPIDTAAVRRRIATLAPPAL